MKRTLMALGVLAPLIYVLTVALGGALQPGYDHGTRFVSELLEAGSPHRGLLSALFGLYNLACLGFGLALFVAARGALDRPRRTTGMTGAVAIVLEGIFGLVTLCVPQDPVGAAMSPTGRAHISMAALSSLASMAGMLLVGLWLRGWRAARGLGLHSLCSVAFVFVTGAAAAAAAAGLIPMAGLLERLTIGGFLQWLLVTAVALPRVLAAEVDSPATPGGGR